MSSTVCPPLVAALVRGEDTTLGPELTDEAVPLPERVLVPWPLRDLHDAQQWLSHSG